MRLATAFVLAGVLSCGSVRAPAQEAPPPLVGVWQSGTGEQVVQVEYTHDGKYLVRVMRGQEVVRRIEGTYRAVGGRLETRVGGKDSVRAWKVDKDQLELTDEQGNKAVVTRLGNAAAKEDAAPPGLPDEKALRERYAKLLPDLTRWRRSPDGHILYTRFEVVKVQAAWIKGDLPVPKIFIMTGDGQGQTPFLYPPDWAEAKNPCWDPQGRGVLFASNFAMHRSALFTDVFWLDFKTGLVIRVTGNEWSAGPVRGFGAIHGIIEDDTYSGRHKDTISISVQGVDQIFHPDGFQKGEGLGGGGAWGFRIPAVPAGDVWVKFWVDKNLADRKIVHVPVNQAATVELSARGGSDLATEPSTGGDGRYVACLWQHPYLANVGQQPNDPDQAPRVYEPDKKDGYDTVALIDTRTGLPAGSWDPMKMQGQPANNPRMSPDGQWIACAAGVTETESIVVFPTASLLRGKPEIRILAAAQRVIGIAPVLTGNTSPAWSPDGKRIAFVRCQSSTQGLTGNLWTINADGTSPRQITRVNVNQLAGSPTWSPDGSRIAFQIITGKRPVLEVTDLLLLNFTCDIYSIGADGSAPRQLTNDGRSADPAWGAFPK